MQTEEEHRNEVKSRYGFSDWAGSVKGDPSVTRTEVQLPEPLVEGWAVERVDSISEGMERVRAANRSLYGRTDAAGRLRVMVRLYEYDTPMAAHEGLIDIVMTYMAPSLPACASVGIQAGDVCFGSHGDVQTGVIFARYNVLVQVESIGGEPTAVTPFVRTIDELLVGDTAPR